MIIVKLREVASEFNIKNAYQFQKFTGFLPSKAADLWKAKWTLANLETLNTLCNLFECTPNDLLEFSPDEDLET